jgi:hypothetical protein
MPRARTAKEKTPTKAAPAVKVKPAAAPGLLGGKKPTAKPVKRAKRVAKPVKFKVRVPKTLDPSQEIPQPAEVVVGRFYELKPESGRVYGELIAVDGGHQAIETMVNGKPSSIRTFKFADQPVREISRELCYELSFTDMHTDKV